MAYSFKFCGACNCEFRHWQYDTLLVVCSNPHNTLNLLIVCRDTGYAAPLSVAWSP
jgi:hypothetical protein